MDINKAVLKAYRDLLDRHSQLESSRREILSLSKTQSESVILEMIKTIDDEMRSVDCSIKAYQVCYPGIEKELVNERDN